MHERKVNRLEILFAQNNAQGIFRHRIETEVGMFIPNRVEILLISNASPVKPLDSRLHGFMNV